MATTMTDFGIFSDTLQTQKQLKQIMGTLSCQGYIKKGWKRLDWPPEGWGLLLKLVICTINVSFVLRTVIYC